ncbi:MAG: hypothetical protein K2Q26_08415 [Bdellovibrionales bacterium]|nr:hypothetical protein [Bdellovibrionales bacterium]
MTRKIFKYIFIAAAVALVLLVSAMIYFYFDSLEEQKVLDQKELAAVLGIDLEARSPVEQLGSESALEGWSIDFFELNEPEFAQIQKNVMNTSQLPHWDQIYAEYSKDYESFPWKKGKLEDQGLPLKICNGFLSPENRGEESPLLTELEAAVRQSEFYYTYTLNRDTPTEYIHLFILWPERKMLMRCSGNL